LGTTDGKIYKLDVAASGYLSWSFKTKIHNFNLMDSSKRPVELVTFYKATTAATTINVGAYYDYSVSKTDLGEITYTPPTVTWGSFNWGDENWEAVVTGLERNSGWIYKDIIRTMQLEFNGTGEFSFLGYGIIFRPDYRLGR